MKIKVKVAYFLVKMFLVTPLFAQLHIGIGISVGPPPPQKEVVVAKPYVDAIWIDGFYQWNVQRHAYIWVGGHWDRPPHKHMVWVPGRWTKRHREWVYYEGRWEKPHKNRKASPQNAPRDGMTRQSGTRR